MGKELLSVAEEFLSSGREVRVLTDSDEHIGGFVKAIKGNWILVDAGDLRSGWFNILNINVLVGK